MKFAKRALSVVLSLTMCAGLAAPALAVEYQADVGTVHVSGNYSWQDNHTNYNSEENAYDHVKEDDYQVTIQGNTDQTVVEVDNGPSDVNVTLDGVTAEVEDGPAVSAQGGSVTIKDSELSTSDADHAAVEIGGDAQVTASGSSTVSGVGTGVHISGSGTLAVEGGELDVSGGETGIHISGSGALTVESGEPDSDGDPAAAPSEQNAAKSGKQDAGGKSGELGLGVGGGYITIAPDSSPSESGVLNVSGGSTGIRLEDSASLSASEDTLVVIDAGGKSLDAADNATVTIAEDGWLLVDGGEVSSITNGSIVIEGLMRVSGKDRADMERAGVQFQGTGLHFVFQGIDESGKPVYHVYWDIGADYEDDKVDIPLSDLMAQALAACGSASKILPGESRNFRLHITNNSEHTYSYTDTSLSVTRPSQEAIESDSAYWPVRCDNLALRALFDKRFDPTSSTYRKMFDLTTKAGFNNLQSMGKVFDSSKLADVENYLRTTGYNGETFESLADYYAYFIGRVTGKEYKSLEEVPLQDLSYVFGTPTKHPGGYNAGMLKLNQKQYEALLAKAEESGAFVVEVLQEGNGQKFVKLKETGALRNAALDYFYGYCAGVGYGGHADYDMANGDPDDRVVYVDGYAGQDSQTLKAAEELIQGLMGGDNQLKDGGYSIDFSGCLLINGPNTGNAFQHLNMDWASTVTLTRSDNDDPGKPTPKEPDDPTPPPPPVEIDEPDIPLAEEPEVEIDEPEVPLAEELEVEIDDPIVPLSDIPQTGDISPLWYAAAGVSACGLLCLLLTKGRKDEEE